MPGASTERTLEVFEPLGVPSALLAWSTESYPNASSVVLPTLIALELHAGALIAFV